MSTPRRLLAQALLLDDPEHCYEALGAEIFSLGHFAHSRRSDDGESSRRSRILGAANRVPQVPPTTLDQRACQRAGQSVAILSAATVLTRARLRYQHGAARTRVRTSRKDGQGWARLLPGRIATQLAVDLGTVSHHLPPPLRRVPRCAGKPRSQVSAQLTLSQTRLTRHSTTTYLEALALEQTLLTDDSMLSGAARTLNRSLQLSRSATAAGVCSVMLQRRVRSLPALNPR